MYDFYLGPAPTNLDEEIRYLLSAKRLLPRWCNSIPDAEFVAMARLLHAVGLEADQRREKLVLVETGVGASTIALAFYALKHKGLSFTWDFNGVKSAEIRQACTETIENAFDSKLSSHWKLVNYMSTSPYLGISILKNWVKKVHFIMIDSEHVWTNTLGELEAVEPFLTDGSVVALDDAYYDFKTVDTAYINIQRKKLGLMPIDPPVNNKTLPHWQETEKFLQERFSSVIPKSDEYKRMCRDDVSIVYFGNELEIRSAIGMEKVKELETRFAAWEVRGRRGSR